MSEATVVDKRTARDIQSLLTRLRDEADLCRNEGALDISWLLDEAAGALEDAQSSVTARDDALASIRVFAQDCIENGYFDKGALGNLYSIRDLCDSKGEAK